MSDNLMFTIASFAQGNPGAFVFLMELSQYEFEEQALKIVLTLKDCPTLRGTNLYVLWSDLCDRDLNKVYNLCDKCPKEVLEDACSRQDYSGRDLIAEYIN